MKRNIPQKIILVFFFVVLLAPLLQQKFHIVESGRLFGAITDSPDVNFTIRGWWDGSYQKKKTFYLNDSFGFRTDFVRMNNQVDYFLYHRINQRSTVVGKNGVLFERSYIDEYNGKDFVGDPEIRGKLEKLKAIQDTLTRLGKTFVFVYAPSKAYYFPDDFPDDLPKVSSKNTNYRSFRRIGDSLGINQIDCNAWFVKMKGKTEGILMSKGGVHWTFYGALMAADSIVRYVENARHIDMPRFLWKEAWLGEPRPQEVDLIAAANLIYPIAKDEYRYPILLEENDSLKTKPDMIFLGDSFLWTFAYNNVMPHISKNWEFWYYFRQAWNQDVGSGKIPTIDLGNYDWFQSLMQKDCLVMLYTEPNLPSIGNDFIEKAYDKFYPKK
ncbi:alginate O-acetyltransferase AlgX-related protein [Taibaiella soli]|uniref:AlgX/AlgJ SGNH hydrolase-like domain-containing protein n=1 Tax=Taibaiella soli TaxID=1649169 RepID=A0A2W2AET8_9BACT|nr:hypothetical protein [Taibaiella soli]PZF73801.1 hypothetical protein DN068_05520 [Taibaiella soli]